LPHDEPAKNAVFWRSGALKPGIILPLSYKTAHFRGLAAVVRFTFFYDALTLLFLMMIVMKKVKRRFYESEIARPWSGPADAGPATNGVRKR
jgi:hypothetical protein